jgi:hypothetical protein
VNVITHLTSFSYLLWGAKILISLTIYGSLSSLVSPETWLRAERLLFDSRQGRPDRLWRPSILVSDGSRVPFSEGGKVRIALICVSIPPICLHGLVLSIEGDTTLLWMLDQAQGKFTVTCNLLPMSVLRRKVRTLLSD